jgi:hypothetical protein
MPELRSNSAVTLAGAGLGFLVPLLCYVIKWFVGPLGGWVVVVWPSSITLMAIEGGGSVTALVAVTISILVNMLLYAAIGRLLAPLILRFANTCAGPHA